MRHLMRDAAPLTSDQWTVIDGAVVAEAKKQLVGRRFLDLDGPLGARRQSVPIDTLGGEEAAVSDFWARGDADSIAVTTRRFIPLATVYSDFVISWHDIENPDAGVRAAQLASARCAQREDKLIFHGDKSLAVEGLCTTKGAAKIAISDWTKGENPIRDVAKAIETLLSKGNSGRRVLVLGDELHNKLFRIQPGTGVMEIDRVSKLVEGGVYRTTHLANQAVMLYCDGQNVDLPVGQDLAVAYMGNEKLDHVFRVMETLTLRVRRPSAIAVLE